MLELTSDFPRYDCDNSAEAGVQHVSQPFVNLTPPTVPHMRTLPANWAPEPTMHRSSLKPWLLLALSVAVLAFCSTLLVR